MTGRHVPSCGHSPHCATGQKAKASGGQVFVKEAGARGHGDPRKANHAHARMRVKMPSSSEGTAPRDTHTRALAWSSAVERARQANGRRRAHEQR
jgi:hypothetical protein